MRLPRLSAGFIFTGMVLLLASDAWAVIYSVGTNQTYTSIGAVPWESLNAGDVVRIHYRPTPYKEKWVIGRQGTSNNWIVIQGVPDAQGNRPVIEGSNATTRLALDYWNENRGVVQIGGSSIPADVMPRYVRIENLDVKSARIPFTFTDDAGTAGRPMPTMRPPSIFRKERTSPSATASSATAATAFSAGTAATFLSKAAGSTATGTRVAPMSTTTTPSPRGSPSSTIPSGRSATRAAREATSRTGPAGA